jgi:hypothetical protein
MSRRIAPGLDVSLPVTERLQGVSDRLQNGIDGEGPFEQTDRQRVRSFRRC